MDCFFFFFKKNAEGDPMMLGASGGKDKCRNKRLAKVFRFSSTSGHTRRIHIWNGKRDKMVDVTFSGIASGLSFSRSSGSDMSASPFPSGCSCNKK